MSHFGATPDALNAYTPPGPDVSAGRLCGVNH